MTIKVPPKPVRPHSTNRSSERTVLTRILGNVTHELKTPLHSILALAQLLESEVDGPLTGEQKKQVTMILRNGQSLLELINLMLTFSALDIGALRATVEEFSPDQLLHDLMESLIPNADLIEGELVSDFSRVRGSMKNDPKLIRQMLLATITSVWEFCPNQFRIEVRASTLDTEALVVTLVDLDRCLPPEASRQFMESLRDDLPDEGRGLNRTSLRAALIRRTLELLGGEIQDLPEARAPGVILSIVLPSYPDQNWENSPDKG